MIANERFTVTPALTQDTRTVAINGFICCWSGVRMQQYVFYGNKCQANYTEIGGAYTLATQDTGKVYCGYT